MTDTDFAARLLRWFDAHGRHDLPWQQARSPYRVWLSEVMLQQTQVTSVIPYFERFVTRFPDLATLAAATVDEVLSHWSGLGYYSRGRNLHRAAQRCTEHHSGELPNTLDELVALPGIGRIRFTTSHPMEFTDRLVDVYANVPKLANYLHLPVQAGSDRILAAMKRGHTAIEYKQKIRKLRAVRPGISISSDFIVGFPGETDADFDKTMKLIEDVGFDQSFSFIYSRRPDTPAADLEDTVTDAEKHARLERLQKHINAHALTISQADGTAVPSKRSLPQVVPVISLGRLAIREDLQGKGFRLGEILLLNAIERVVEVSNLGSGVALVVDAKHDHAASFYRKYGFTASPDSPLMLYLPISVCRALVMAP